MNGIRLSEKEKDIEKVADILKVMAHPLRLKILCLLKNDKLPVYKIRAQIGTSLANISQHLYILKNNKMVKSERGNNTVLYKMQDAKILRLIINIKKILCCKKR